MDKNKIREQAAGGERRRVNAEASLMIVRWFERARCDARSYMVESV